jgi:hypothetical protein
MSSTSKTELRREEEHSQVQRLAIRIGRYVLQALGTPPGWHAVRVQPLWDGRFRANVLIGEGPTSCTIAHSFFLVTDGSGNVLESSPQIVKRY